MATVNYSWNLPTVGGSEDTWGTSLNANWTDLDTLLGGVSQTEFAILDGATVSTAELNILDGVTATAAELNLLDGAVDHATAAWEAGTATEAGVPSPADVKAAIDALASADFSAVAADIIPDADSTRDIGSTSTRWAQGWFDDVTSTNTSDGTLSIPTTYVTNGSAKAWVNLDGTGTIAARDSFNVSSLVDDGTGLYTVNYSNAMANSGYATGFDGSGGTDRQNTLAFGINRTTTTIQIDVETTSGTQVDLDTVEGVIHGELA